MDDLDKFDKWNELKKDIQDKKWGTKVRNGHVYWLSIGMNIGSEVYGKDDKFSRPVLVIRKLRKTSFIGIPLSTKGESKGFSYPLTDCRENKTVYAKLDQIRTFDTKRVLSYRYKAKNEELQQIKEVLKELIFPTYSH